MAFTYVDTPRTEAGDRTNFSAANLSFSLDQAYPSPSKDPSNNLLHQLKSRNGGAVLRTPRARNALSNVRNAGARNEFTPLLKSAAHSRFFHSSRKLNGLHEEKENEGSADDLVNSMMAAGPGGVPRTPAYLKPGYVEVQTPGLPVNSSVLDEDHTGSSAGMDRTPAPPNVASSSLMSTPMPILPPRGEEGRGDQGNVLTLREQEAKLAQLDKENFNLKLKIHFLDDALKRTGTEYQQETIRQNTELKVEQTHMSQEIKTQRKAIQRAENELEQYRQQLREYAEKVKKRHTDEIMKEEMERLRKLAEESQRVADERDQEIEDLQRRLEAAEQGTNNKAQDLQDDIQDLEQELRAKDLELDAKDEELDNLQDKIKSLSANSEGTENLQEQVANLEAELDEKEAEISTRDEKIVNLTNQVKTSQDRDKSTRKLRGDVDVLENQLREKEQVIDEKEDELRSLEKRIQAADRLADETRQKDAELRETLRQLEQKEGELSALQERLQTARGSWDAEAQQTDARLQEKDRLVQDAESRLRDHLRLVDERNEEITKLQRRLQSMETESGETARRQNRQTQQQSEQIQDLQEKLRTVNVDADSQLDDKDRKLRHHAEQLERLEQELDVKARQSQQLERDLQSLQNRLSTVESPSKKDNLLNQQAVQIRDLQSSLDRLANEKDAELDVLEAHLATAETEAEAQQMRIGQLQERVKAAERDQSFAGHLDQDVHEKQQIIDEQENQLLEMQNKLRKAIQDKDADFRALQQQIQAAQSDAATQVDHARAQLESEHAEAKEALEDEIVVLESSLDEAQAAKASLTKTVASLERDIDALRRAAESGTPIRERKELRSRIREADAEHANLRREIHTLEQSLSEARTTAKQARSPSKDDHKLLEAQSSITRLSSRVAELESELMASAQERTIATERLDLHALLKDAKLETESLASQLAQQTHSLSSANRKEAETRVQLHAAQSELADLQTELSSAEARLSTTASRETSLRSQLAELNSAHAALQDIEHELSSRKSSSSGHARREAELRIQLRDARAELADLSAQTLDKDEKLAAAARKEAELRARLKSGSAHHGGDETVRLEQDEMRAQLADAEIEVLELRNQLGERETRLGASKAREAELRARLKNNVAAAAVREVVAKDGNTSELVEARALVEAKEKTHVQEMRGLVKQIQFLRAKCAREEAFRNDLVFVKRWFVMQVEMYGACNKADLRLLSDMGISAPRNQMLALRKSEEKKRPSLKAVACMVLASVRMKRLQAAWAGNKKLHEALLRKLEGMKKRQGYSHGQAGQGQMVKA